MNKQIIQIEVKELLSDTKEVLTNIYTSQNKQFIIPYIEKYINDLEKAIYNTNNENNNESLTEDEINIVKTINEQNKNGKLELTTSQYRNIHLNILITELNKIKFNELTGKIINHTSEKTIRNTINY